MILIAQNNGTKMNLSEAKQSALEQAYQDYKNNPAVHSDYNEQTQLAPIFQNFLDQLVGQNDSAQKEIQNLQTQIQQLQQPKDDDSSLVGNLMNFIPFIVILVLVFLMLYLFSQDVEKRIKNLRKENESLKTTINNLEVKIAKLSTPAPSPANYVSQPPPIPDYNFNNQFVNSPPPNELPQMEQRTFQPSTTLAKKPKPQFDQNLVDECNNLRQLSGLQRKTESNKLIQKYKLRAFICENANERMNNPDAEPIFREAPTGDYWGYQDDMGKFIIVPSVTVYNDNIHNERAMKTVFRSNFESGKSYENIFVERPAIFDSQLKVKEMGSLRLS